MTTITHTHTTANGRALRVNLDTVEAVLTDLLDSKQLKKAIATILETKSARNSTKVNEEGLVYCNYFGTYMDESDFRVKANDKFASMSKLGEQLNKLTKSYIKKATDEALSNFKSKKLSATELDATLEQIEQNSKLKFDSVKALEKALV